MESKKNKNKKEKKKIKRDVAKVLNKGDYSRYLSSINPYYQTLADPFNVHGLQIPDMVMFPSAPFTLVKRFQMTAGAVAGSHNVCAAIIGFVLQKTTVSYGGFIPADTTAGTKYALGCTANNLGATSSSLFPSGALGVPFVLQYDQWDGSSDAVPTLFQKVRLVSAGLAVDYTGTAFDSKGRIVCAFLPRGGGRIKYQSTDLSVDVIASFPGSRVIPISKLIGCTVLYRPQDPVSLVYSEVDLSIDVSSSAQPQEFWGGEMYVAADNMTEGAILQATLICNYEGIPRTNQMNLVAGEVSKYDPLSLAHGLNAAQELPVAKAGTREAEGLIGGKTQVAAPQSGNNTSSLTHTERSDKGLPMIEQILGTIESGLGRALPIAEKAGGIVKAFL